MLLKFIRKMFPNFLPDEAHAKLEQPVKPVIREDIRYHRLLAEDMIRGHYMIPEETRWNYFKDNRACAIGAAWVGSGRSQEAFYALPNPFYWPWQTSIHSVAIGKRWNVSDQVINQIISDYMFKVPRLEIANRLKQGTYLNL